MVEPNSIEPSTMKTWFPPIHRHRYIDHLIGRVGLTRRRAECFVLLCAYLMLKQMREKGILSDQKPPITQLRPPLGMVQCSYSEASELFYQDGEQGSERAAGMMINKLVKLQLVEKQFDGNTLNLSIPFLPSPPKEEGQEEECSFIINGFNRRRDAISVADLLSKNYAWMDQTAEALPLRISRLLKTWSDMYGKGMRVLRRSNNDTPIGFYLFFPVAPESEQIFFGPASSGLHLSAISDEDSFKIASHESKDCEAVFVRSWVIEKNHRDEAQPLLLRDAQNTFKEMIQDFPNLCDIYTLIIHPSYEPLVQYLGFKKIGSDTPIYWVHLPIDNFLEMDISDRLPPECG